MEVKEFNYMRSASLFRFELFVFHHLGYKILPFRVNQSERHSSDCVIDLLPTEFQFGPWQCGRGVTRLARQSSDLHLGGASVSYNGIVCCEYICKLSD